MERYETAVTAAKLSAAGSSRRDRRRTETRERLYEAAMHLLTERDFDAVTVEMITEAADVGKGTFFNYFANKEAVVGYRFEKQFQMLTATLQAELPESTELSCPIVSGAMHPIGGPIWKRLIAITHLGVDYDAHSKRLTRSLLALALTHDEIRAASQNVEHRVIEALEALVLAGQASGEFRADLPARAVVEYLTDVYFTTLLGWAKTDGDEELHFLVERTFELAWSGLRPA
jgi:AcrR family transcriptional regulator